MSSVSVSTAFFGDVGCLKGFDDRLWSAWLKMTFCPRRAILERGFSRRCCHGSILDCG